MTKIHSKNFTGFWLLAVKAGYLSQAEIEISTFKVEQIHIMPTIFNQNKFMPKSVLTLLIGTNFN